MSTASEEETLGAQCKDCKKTFFKPGDLKRHVDSVHKGIKHTCPYCGDKLTEKGSLRKHIKSQHTLEEYEKYLATEEDGRSTRATKNPKKFFCDIKGCRSNGFTNNCNLKNHLEKIHGIQQVCA